VCEAAARTFIKKIRREEEEGKWRAFSVLPTDPLSILLMLLDFGGKGKERGEKRSGSNKKWRGPLLFCPMSS
jgi:hypothetical protein